LISGTMDRSSTAYQSLRKYKSHITLVIAVLVVMNLALGIIITYQTFDEHTGKLKVYQLSFGLGDCTDEEAEEYTEIIGQTIGEELHMGFSEYMMIGGSWDGSKIVYDGITARLIIIDTDNKLTNDIVKNAIKVAQSRTNNGFVMMEYYWSDAELQFPIGYQSEIL